MHALIIDDDRYSLSVLSQILSMEDVESTTISVPSTLDRVLTGLPAVDIVFLDLEMPGMSGVHVLQKLKTDPRFENVPIVACTVHISEMSALRDHGFDGFIGKPIDADTFSAKFHKIMNGEAVWAM
jgi:CheY-like chemotaxis protein